MQSLLPLILTACIHSNPPVTREIRWIDAETASLARRACYDCHSNETVWPWYSHLPVVSGLVRRDVESARAEMNFSTWNRGNHEAHEAPEAIAEGEMPLPLYLRHHPAARLSEDEAAALIVGLEATLVADPPPGRHHREGERQREAREEREDREEHEEDDEDDDHGRHGGRDDD